MMDRKTVPQYIMVAALTALITTLAIGAGFYAWLMAHPESLAGALDAALYEEKGGKDKDSDAASLYSFESVIVDTVTKANPAVVAITVLKDVPVYERYYEGVPGPFGGFFGIPQVRQNGTEKREVGGGSGFLVSADGYIVTNRHVVDDESADYVVFTNDGRQYPATVVARDSGLDLAVIKIDASGLPYLPFGDSDALQVGQTVIAIGNALAEFRNTVSTGIVSGLSRSIVASGVRGNAETLDQLIQTDAAINGGNSGGPLLNLSGEVVGVNVAVASGAENIGFALSANSVKSAVESVKATGAIVRPYLGVRYVPITEELQRRNNLPVDYGVVVAGGTQASDPAIIPGSPADKAGIIEGDIILEIDDIKLTSERNLAAIIRGKKVGDTVELTVLREGAEQTISVRLEELQ